MDSFQGKPGDKQLVLRQQLGTWIQIFSLFDEKHIPESMLPLKMQTNIRLFIHETEFPAFGTTLFPENRWKNGESELSLPRIGKKMNCHRCSYCIHAYFLPTSLFLNYQFQHFVRFSTCQSCGMETQHVHGMRKCVLLVCPKRCTEIWPQVAQAAAPGHARGWMCKNAVTAFSAFVNTGLNLQLDIIWM